jgi:hypothetical protein
MSGGAADLHPVPVGQHRFGGVTVHLQRSRRVQIKKGRRQGRLLASIRNDQRVRDEFVGFIPRDGLGGDGEL